jgi:hypothetical protein
MFKSIFKFVDEVIVEPVLFSVALVWVLPHIQYVFNNSALSFILFWSNLWMDIRHFPWVYVPFVALFVWWSISRGIRRYKDDKNRPADEDIRKRTLEVLERLEKRLDDYDKRTKSDNSNTNHL